MAKYRQIHVTFWQDTFVLDLTPEEKYFYLYLMTNSKTTACGIYELPKKVMEMETGYNRETVEKLLTRFIEYGKVLYSDKTKEIYLTNWIKFNEPKGELTTKCVVGELNTTKDRNFANSYIRDADLLGYPLQGAYKGLIKVSENKTSPYQVRDTDTDTDTEVDTDREMEMDTELETETEPNTFPAEQKNARPPDKPVVESPTAPLWQAYSQTYRQRYGVNPVRNAKVNGQFSQLLKRLGAEESPHVAAHYVRHNKQLYVSAKHSVDLLLRDAEGLRTEWATNTMTTNAEARQLDARQGNFNAFAPLLAEAREKEKANG